MIKVKRAYKKSDESDGFRILVDRLWPRGLNKKKANIHMWLKDIAPSNELREWFAHDPEKWNEFKKKYFEELNNKRDLNAFILNQTKKGTVTLIYGAANEKQNNAVALKEYVENTLLE